MANTDQATAEKATAANAKKPAPQVAAATVETRSSALHESEESELPKKPAAKAKRRGLLSRLGGWLRREKSAKKSTARAKSPGNGAGGNDGGANEDDGEAGDDSSIDWASLSKAERRRLRRELKRGGEAA